MKICVLACDVMPTITYCDSQPHPEDVDSDKRKLIYYLPQLINGKN